MITRYLDPWVSHRLTANSPRRYTEVLQRYLQIIGSLGLGFELKHLFLGVFRVI